MSWLDMLPKMARFSPSRITVGVTEQTARRRLKLKRTEPIIWRGIPLNCIGSTAWRRRIWEIRDIDSGQSRPKCAGCGTRFDGPKVVCTHCLELAGAIDRSADTSKPNEAIADK